jgi:hypothetical protein
MTAFGGPKERAEAIAATFSAYVGKPIDLRGLAETIHEIAGRGRDHR